MTSPTVGKIVYFTPHTAPPEVQVRPGPKAALVVGVHDGGVCELIVFGTTGMYWTRSAFSSEPRSGCWSWMPGDP